LVLRLFRSDRTWGAGAVRPGGYFAEFSQDGDFVGGEQPSVDVQHHQDTSALTLDAQRYNQRTGGEAATTAGILTASTLLPVLARHAPDTAREHPRWRRRTGDQRPLARSDDPLQPQRRTRCL
jgi:hypothetical protein